MPRGMRESTDATLWFDLVDRCDDEFTDDA